MYLAEPLKYQCIFTFIFFLSEEIVHGTVWTDLLNCRFFSFLVYFHLVLNTLLRTSYLSLSWKRSMCSLLPGVLQPFNLWLDLYAWMLFVVFFLSTLCISFKQENSREENRGLVHQISNESRLSIADSLTEFFDAQEVLLSASSSENEVWALRLTLFLSSSLSATQHVVFQCANCTSDDLTKISYYAACVHLLSLYSWM